MAVNGNGPTGRKGGDEILITALASGMSMKTAARQAGMSERTVYRRLDDPLFRARVQHARTEFLNTTVGRLLAVGTKAVNALAGSLKSKDENVRNRAAIGILSHLIRGIEVTDLAQQVAELRDLLTLKDKDNGTGSTEAGSSATARSDPPAPAGEGQSAAG